jgi:sugar lactone lactonase YvrE
MNAPHARLAFSNRVKFILMFKNQKSFRKLAFISIVFFFLFSSRPNFGASAPVVWEINARAELLRGEARGVSITDTGALTLAPRFARLFDTEQAFVWSSAADAQGNVYLGTGHDGKIFRVAPDGSGKLFYKAAELDVTALTVGRDGELYAGTSPDGKVYRINADGKAEVFFDPPEKYIWALALMNDGSLAVATGETGKIYRVRAAGAKPDAALLAKTNQSHVISLTVDARGDLIAGTDPGGYVLRVSSDGKMFALYDSPLREIHALAAAPDGAIYALAMSEAATGRAQATSAATPTAAATSAATTSEETSGAAAATTAAQTARSRSDLSNAKSAVVRITPDGGADVLWSSTSIVAFSLALAPNNAVLIGTSDKGRIYSINEAGRDTLLIQSSEDQISTFVARGSRIYAASSNAGKLFRFSTGAGAELVDEGSYESPVRDTKLGAKFGRITWRGRGQVELQTRTGNTDRPDATWSEWSAPYRDSLNSSVTSPRARFIQWRAVLRSANQGANAAANETARVENVRLFYQPRNVAPDVLAVNVLPIGIALQPVVIPTQPDPNAEAAGIDAAALGTPQVVAPPRRTFQRGAISLTWQAEDRNGDEMEYSVYYRGVNETTFRLLKDHIRETFYTVDGAALPDGRYVFKVVASDAPDNPIGQALTGERTSEEVEVDNTPPKVSVIGEPQTANGRVRVRFSVDDGAGTVKRADVSLDGATWRAVVPDDGIADSPRENYTIDLPVSGAGEHTISLRAFDANGNVGSARVRFVQK